MCEKWLAIINNLVMIWIICVVRQGSFVAYHRKNLIARNISKVKSLTFIFC